MNEVETRDQPETAGIAVQLPSHARYLVTAVAMPVGLSLLFTGLFGSHAQRRRCPASHQTAWTPPTPDSR
jgi:hypothetical protein